MRLRRPSGRRLAIAALVPLGLFTAGAAIFVRAGLAPVEWGAAAILHPVRRPLTRHPSRPYETVRFSSEGARLEGWLFRAAGERRASSSTCTASPTTGSPASVWPRVSCPRATTSFTFDARAHGHSTGGA